MAATVAISRISARPLVALRRSTAASVSHSSSRQFLLRHRSTSSPRLLSRLRDLIKLLSFCLSSVTKFFIDLFCCFFATFSGTLIELKRRLCKTMKRKLWLRRVLKQRLFLVKRHYSRRQIRVLRLVIWSLGSSSSSKESMSSLL